MEADFVVAEIEVVLCAVLGVETVGNGAVGPLVAADDCDVIALSVVAFCVATDWVVGDREVDETLGPNEGAVVAVKA